MSTQFRIFSIIIATLCLWLKIYSATKFKINPEDGVFRPCPGREKDYLTTFFDMDHVVTKRIDDNTILLDGYISVKKQLTGNPTFVGKATTQRKERGVWVDTAFSIIKEDLCKSMFDPNEIWANLVKDFEGAQRECPPKAGTNFTWDNYKADLIIDTDAPINLNGEYRIKFLMGGKDFEMCTMATSEVEKLK